MNVIKKELLETINKLKQAELMIGASSSEMKNEISSILEQESKKLLKLSQDVKK